MNRPRKRRGVVMALLMMILAMLVGIFGVLNTFSLGQHRDHVQGDLDRAARLAATSAADWTRQHPEVWTDAEKPKGIAVDIEALMPPHATGSAILRCQTEDGRRTAQIKVEVRRNNANATTRVNLQFEQ